MLVPSAQVASGDIEEPCSALALAGKLGLGTEFMPWSVPFSFTKQLVDMSP